MFIWRISTFRISTYTLTAFLCSFPNGPASVKDSSTLPLISDSSTFVSIPTGVVDDCEKMGAKTVIYISGFDLPLSYMAFAVVLTSPACSVGGHDFLSF